MPLLVVAVVMMLLPAAASELPDSDGGGAVADEPTLSGSRLPLNLGSQESQHVWINSKAGLAYFLSGLDASGVRGYLNIVAVDTATGAEAARESLVHDAYVPLTFNKFGSGYESVLTVDEHGARVFVATTAELTSAAARHTDLGAGRTCVATNLGHSRCVTGVSVLDAATLEHLRHIPLRSLQADAPILAPQLVAMSFSPAREGVGDKLHLLVQDGGTSSYTADGAAAMRWNPRTYHNVTYAVQMDVASGQQDWVVRLDACRAAWTGGALEDYAEAASSPHQGAIFSSRQGARAIYAACLTDPQGLTGGVVRIPVNDDGFATVGVVPGAALDEEPDEPGVNAPNSPPSAPTGPSTPRLLDRPFTAEGPDRVTAIIPDPDSGRILMQVQDGQPAAMVWYVFDTMVMQFIGTIGIGGPVAHKSSMSGLSADGRLYTFTSPLSAGGKSFAGGLFVVDIRRTPVSQALHYPRFAAHYPKMTDPDFGANHEYFRYALVPEQRPGGGNRLWWPNGLDNTSRSEYLAIEDLRPALEIPPPDAVARTIDVDEVDGVTQATFDGVARGFGFRALLIAGVEGAARLGPVDPVGSVAQCADPDWDGGEGGVEPFGTAAQYFDTVLDISEGQQILPNVPASAPRRTTQKEGPCRRMDRPVPLQCVDANREAVFAYVGPEGAAILDGNGSRGAAEPVYLDTLTTTDASAPASRCTGAEWDALWASALFGRAPIPEPSGGSAAERVRVMAECLSSSDQTSEKTGDAVTGGYSAGVNCGDEASGHAYTRAVGVEGVTVSEALSSFRIYRDPGRGIVSRVESVVRGVNIPPLVRIDTVRGVAESWANGRASNSPPPEAGESYDPNCDFERTAGTCFQRHLFGLWTPGYRCGPCGDEQAFVEGLNAVLNPYASARLREPDHRLRIGAENGFIAAVQKPEHERFADLVLNLDLMQTTLPTLEIIRQAPPNRVASRGGPRGRQIYQFAGVEVSSSYSIQCLLVYDEESNTCGAAVEPPGAISVSLQDGAGEPLAGGGFEVRADVDADGVLGLVDTLLPEGACVTTDDGVGTCRFENLAPGPYLVNQVAAPPGYAKSDEPFVVELGSGEDRTVAFTNVSNLSTIELKAADPDGQPLSGASFAAYPDPDSDGKVAPDAQPAAQCTTDESGACTMSVPAGSYVLVQTAAPGGLEGIEPVPFTFASGGQVAAVTITNYPPEAPVAPQPQPGPVYTDPVDVAPPVETVGEFEPVPTVDEPAPTVSVPEAIGGTVVQVIRAPGDALRLLARDPKQAAAWMAALALFCLAVLAVRRRQQAVALIKIN